MDWVLDHDWESWLTLALVLTVFEITSGTFILLMLGVGALAGVLLALLGVSFVWQCLAAVVVAVALLAVVRPRLVRRLSRHPELVTGAAGLIGTTGIVLEDVSDRAGLVRLDGGPWTARVSHSGSAPIQKGVWVRVTAIQGATAYVEEDPR